MLPTVSLSLCCNHHRNGMFAGLLYQIAVDDTQSETLLHLDSPWADRYLKVAIEKDWFRLGKSHTWHHYGHQTWVGNWCWDAVLVATDCAADVLNWVLSKGYRMESGLCWIGEKIDAGEQLKGSDFYAAVPRERQGER